MHCVGVCERAAEGVRDTTVDDEAEDAVELVRDKDAKGDVETVATSVRELVGGGDAEVHGDAAADTVEGPLDDGEEDTSAVVDLVAIMEPVEDCVGEALATGGTVMVGVTGAEPDSVAHGEPDNERTTEVECRTVIESEGVEDKEVTALGVTTALVDPEAQMVAVNVAASDAVGS